MDPLNNPTPTPNPGPTPEPDLGSAPKIGDAVVGGGASASPVASVTPPTPPTPPIPPVTPPTPPVTPADPLAASGPVTPPTPPVTPPTPPVAPVSIDGLSAPVNPIINPSNPANPTMGNSALNPEGVAPTAPIMMPEPAPAPDPVEEELKAPMKATPPAPGSIGSAVSGPEGEIGRGAAAGNPFSENKQIPSVSFNDPATQPEPVGSGTGASEKPKSNPKTLMALIIVAAMIVIALVAILLLQIFDPFGSQNPNSSSTPNNETTIQDQPDSNTTNNDATNNTSVVAATSSLSCTRNMTKAEIAEFNDAITGTISASAEFSSDDLLTTVSVVKSVTYSDEDATDNEPVEVEVHETTADELTPTNALNYYLPVDDDGELELTSNAVQTNYESLDFTCEVL